jgi:uncharacterized protein (DUF2141 family)
MEGEMVGRFTTPRPLALALALAALPFGGVDAADLTVTIAKIRNNHGNILAGLYGSADQWPDGTTVADATAKAASGKVTIIFHNLPPGTYAVSAFHDENANGKFDTNDLGFPLEGFAFSNDVKPFLSAPMFEAAAIDVGATSKSITMRMQYWRRPE